MNMVGVDVVRRSERRRSLPQAGDRQAVRSINSGRAQDTHDNTTAAKSTQLALGIDTPMGTGGGGPDRASLINARTGAIAIDAAGTYIHDSLW